MILTDQATAVYLDDLVPNPDNPRKDSGDITDLAASIVAQGVLQPLLVTSGEDGKYLVVDGHRRLAALRQLDFEDTIPVRVVDMDRTQRLLAALTAGLHGRPLTPLDEAGAFQHLVDLGLTQRQIAEQVGCNQSHVSKRLLLIALPDSAKASLGMGVINVREAERFARTGSVEAPKPAKPDTKLLERDNATLRAEVVQLREVAEKARAAVVEVRAELDAQPTATLEVTDDEVDDANASFVAAAIALIERFAPAQGDWPSDEHDAAVLAWLERKLAAPDPVDNAPGILEMASDVAAWTRKPWGTYEMSSDERLITMIRKLNGAAKVHHVIAWERTHDARPHILAAAADRLFEIG